MPTGTSLPEFDLPTSGGGRVTNADLAGAPTVLYLYPKDDTPGCTIEAHEFTALLPEFEAKGVRVYGVSPDSAKSHDRFSAKCGLSVPLIADENRVLIEALGSWVEKSMYGRTYMGVERSTFVVGRGGTVDREWRQVKAKGHAAEVLSTF